MYSSIFFASSGSAVWAALLLSSFWALLGPSAPEFPLRFFMVVDRLRRGREIPQEGCAGCC